MVLRLPARGVLSPKAKKCHPADRARAVVGSPPTQRAFRSSSLFRKALPLRKSFTEWKLVAPPALSIFINAFGAATFYTVPIFSPFSLFPSFETLPVKPSLLVAPVETFSRPCLFTHVTGLFCATSKSATQKDGNARDSARSRSLSLLLFPAEKVPFPLNRLSFTLRCPSVQSLPPTSRAVRCNPP
jgi:hypothetical protein